jgi:hypothetical protein
MREQAFSRWGEASRIPPPPGDGVIYTSGADRSSLGDGSMFTKFPNSLPRDTGVSNLFLAPQHHAGALSTEASAWDSRMSRAHIHRNTTTLYRRIMTNA